MLNKFLGSVVYKCVVDFKISLYCQTHFFIFYYHCYFYISNTAFAQIVPTGLQLFEYSSLSINCEGLNPETGWTVKRRRKGEVSACVSNWVTTTTSVCAIKPVYLTDSGEYWCEIGGERSNTVNITVTGNMHFHKKTFTQVTHEL